MSVYWSVSGWSDVGILVSAWPDWSDVGILVSVWPDVGILVSVWLV